MSYFHRGRRPDVGADEEIAPPAASTSAMRMETEEEIQPSRKLQWPGTSHIVVLTEPAAAPRTMSLLYSICIPCRQAISRCDGHENYTRACTQCSSRGDVCSWQLSAQRHAAKQEPLASLSRSGDYRDQRATLRRHAYQQEDDTSFGRTIPAGASAMELLEDNMSQSSASDAASDADTTVRPTPQETTTERAESSKSAQNRWRYRFPLSEDEQKGTPRKPSVPSAGWDTVLSPIAQTATQTGLSSKAKGKQRAADPAMSERTMTIPHTQPSYSNEDGQTAEQAYEATVSQLLQSKSGFDFLEITTYDSLLKTMFAEESCDLAKSLCWWEFSADARDNIRGSRLDVRSPDKKRWRKIPYFELLLAENAHNWSLWPRRVQEDQILSNRTGSAVLCEQIEALVSGTLHTSSLPDEILFGLSDIHRRSLALQNRNNGFPATMQSVGQWRRTVFQTSKYVIPLPTEDAPECPHDRNDLVLDILEALSPFILPSMEHTLKAIFLKIAQLRQPVGMRRPPKVRQKDQGKKSFLGKRKRTSDVQMDASQTPQLDSPSSISANLDAETEREPEPIANVTGTNLQDANLLHSQKQSKSKSKTAATPPIDWQKVLLAAATLPDSPPLVIANTLQRLEQLYGSSDHQILALYDASRSSGNGRRDLASTTPVVAIPSPGPVQNTQSRKRTLPDQAVPILPIPRQPPK